MSKAQPASQCHPADSTRHTIRLHGPWQVEPLPLTPGELPAARTVKFPATWQDIVGADFRGRVRCTRRFGRPTNLDAKERVDLVVRPTNGLTGITLNGTRLVETGMREAEYRVEVTSWLLPRNELQLELNLPAGRDDVAAAAGIAGGVDVEMEVYLEIYESAP